MGIEVVDTDILTMGQDQYVHYKLPIGWKTVDNSWRQDLPEFLIIDNNNMTRVSISGAWKGAYDNHLTLIILEGKQIKLYESPNDTTVEASQTSNANLMGQFAEAFDPLHRPYNKQERVDRIDDHEGM